jgi:hypothetical protein
MRIGCLDIDMLRHGSAQVSPGGQNPLDWTTVFMGDIRFARRMKGQLPKYGIPDIAQSDVASKKRSDTLFVFGSGPTINDLSDHDFEFIRNHDSLGFNYFLVHDFVPDFYCYEAQPSREHYDFFCELLNMKSQYDGVSLIIQFQHFEGVGFDIGEMQPERRRTYFVAPYRYKATNPSMLRVLLRLRKAYSVIRPFHLGSVIHHGGSISYIVSMAYALGYKKIILLGVDMFNKEYFFTEKPDNQHKQRMVELENRAAGGKAEYRGGDPKSTAGFCELPPDVFLRLFNEIFLIPAGVTLFAGSPKSRLAEFLPAFSFPNTA